MLSILRSLFTKSPQAGGANLWTNNPKLQTTPGPWYVEHVAGRDFSLIRSSLRLRPDFPGIAVASACKTGMHWTETLGNTHLIAAAPDLLVVVKEVLKNRGILDDETLFSAQFAVAKAEGRLLNRSLNHETVGN